MCVRANLIFFATAVLWSIQLTSVRTTRTNLLRSERQNKTIGRDTLSVDIKTLKEDYSEDVGRNLNPDTTKGITETAFFKARHPIHTNRKYDSVGPKQILTRQKGTQNSSLNFVNQDRDRVEQQFHLDINNNSGIQKRAFSYIDHISISVPPTPIDDRCELALTSESLDTFRHVVYYSESTYVYLRLNVANESEINITGSKYILEERIWVWTFFGKQGSLEYLEWPEEFGIWSMGLLYDSVIREPMDITLERLSGNCSNLEVGNKADDAVISRALKNLTEEMIQLHEKYAPSFYCYKRRLFIEDESMYMLSKHVVCPVESISHSCCTFYYNKALSKRVVGCMEIAIKYDVLWWIIPIVIAVVLFIYSPILITYFISTLFGSKKGTVVVKSSRLSQGSINSLSDSSRLVPEEKFEVILLAGHKHVTLLGTLLIPLKAFGKHYVGGTYSNLRLVGSRLSRIVIPILSLSFIALQLLLDHIYLTHFVLEAMAKGVPLGFRSMLGGYTASKENFLPYLGGPYAAVTFYVCITSLLIVFPESPIEVVTRKLKSDSLERSPLSLNIRTIGSLGTVRTTNRNAYSRLYHLLQAQCYMLLNYKFYQRCFHIQAERWHSWSLIVCCKVLFFPFYIVFCIVEFASAIVFYAFPIVSFGHYIVSGYVSPLISNNRRFVGLKLCSILLAIVMFTGVVFSIFMFCTIFLDATLLLTRLFIFTFTGIIVYPKVAYGYLIFGLTVFYYLWDSVSDYSHLYQQLFKDTVQAAMLIQRANDSENIVHKINGENGLSAELFEFVIEVHRPRRKQLFLSILKAGIVLTILWMLIHLLLTTDNFRELHVIMHVGTALFICALPQIAKTLCKGKENKKKHKRFRKDLADTVRVFKGYFINDDELSCESD